MDLEYNKEFYLFVIRLLTAGALKGYILRNSDIYQLAFNLISYEIDTKIISYRDVHSGVFMYIDSDILNNNVWSSKINIITKVKRPYLEMVLQGIPHSCVPHIEKQNSPRVDIKTIIKNDDTSTLLFKIEVETNKLNLYLHDIENWVESLKCYCLDNETLKIVVDND